MSGFAARAIEAAGGIVGEVGLWTVAAAAVMLLLVKLLADAADRALAVCARAADVWRRVPPGARRAAAAGALAWAAVTWLPALITARALWVAACTGYAAWWIWAAVALRPRLQPAGDWTAASLWLLHARTLAAGRQTAQALSRVTGSSERLVESSDGPDRVVVLPPSGMSAAALAARITDGAADSALIRAGMTPAATATATALPDGRVEIVINRAPTAPESPADHTTEPRIWTPS